ncbi:MAG TPA: hypothetical protein DDY14_11420 [Chromatiaceae bacterium]|jgi:glycosyltransferase involved in cell wall biosynthesis|nr:MAG: glycosyltransferase [Thiohalocapsa sp. PB-PSB1]HBG95899.1 hypothetical protein [Chromatiaceae bacterium]HCS91811.1 hypothetical protein [Chromatiaceae bacterium]
MNSKPVFFTICARNYLGFATTLGASLKQHHRDAEIVVWLLDEGELPKLPDDLVIRFIPRMVEAEEWIELSLNFNIRELATAVKPLCFLKHLEEGARRVIYIDPDILVFRPLNEALEMLEQGAQGVLTPHIMQPLPRDGEQPDDLELLGAGVFNLGFLAVAAGPETDRFLKWWASWLRTHCFEDKSTGTFTDQKWVNFAPVFCPSYVILRHPGYNLAYWNLPQRELELCGDEWQADGQPLVFFHFSGFDPSAPEILSKHQTRVIIARGSPLARLLQLYANKLRGSCYDEALRLRFPPLRFANGIEVDDFCRAIYREARANGKYFRNPLSDGPNGLFEWVTKPIERSRSSMGYLNRYLRLVNARRPDIAATYPDFLGSHWNAYVAWLYGSGRMEMGLNEAFLPPKRGLKIPSAELSESQDFRVTYVGYLSAHLGLGEAARGNVKALRALGIPVDTIDVSHFTSSERQATLEAETASGMSDDSSAERVVILHVNADQLANVLTELGTSLTEDAYVVGMWAWETRRFPSHWWYSFSLLDEIWVGGSYMAEGIAAVSPIPVLRIPHVVEPLSVRSDRSAFGLADDEFIFLFMFDFHSTPARKNPEGAIRAFRQAFHPSEPVRLVVKSMNGRNRPESFTRLRKMAAEARITFIDAALGSDDRYKLISSTDVFLSLHRAEGFGLGIAEAMALGKPVVATGWSGNMDFMSIANSLPVRYRLTELAEADPPYDAGTIWAEPEIDHASELMRRLWEEPELVARIGARAQSDSRDLLSVEHVGRLMSDRLERIAELRSTRPDRLHISAASTTPYSTLLGIRNIRRSPLRLVLHITRTSLFAVIPRRYQPAYHRIATKFAHRMGYLRSS